jgi:RNA polymerase sigma-70 factor (ECF subfamily)
LGSDGKIKRKFGKPNAVVAGSYMASANANKHEAFLRLFLEHEDALRGFVRALAASREDAREVMQEAAAVLWRKFDSLGPPADFRSWAFGVARMQAREFYRDKGRDRHVFAEDVQALIEQRVEAQTKRLDARQDALDECLGKLPADQRELVNEAYATGAQIDEIARGQGRTPMALYKTLHRIRLALLDCTQRALSREGLA